MMRRSKKQYVEHNEEHVGEEVTPFVSFLVEENRMKKSVEQQTTDGVITKITTPGSAKKKVRFWRRVTALFS